MAWPPKVPDSPVTDSTPMAVTHPTAHNETADAIAALIDRTWTGTQSEYDQLGSYDPDRLYFIVAP